MSLGAILGVIILILLSVVIVIDIVTLDFSPLLRNFPSLQSQICHKWSRPIKKPRLFGPATASSGSAGPTITEEIHHVRRVETRIEETTVRTVSAKPSSRLRYSKTPNKELFVLKESVSVERTQTTLSLQVKDIPLKHGK